MATRELDPGAASLANLEVFVRTYELGNFTRAAAALAITPQAASRALARLEAHVGVTLFRRTTRALEATDAGRAYYGRCRAALDLLATGARELADARGSGATGLRGAVRISVGTIYGHHVLIPALAAFARAHPEVDVTVQIDNRNVDFARDNYDLAIRLGAIREHALVARKLGDFTLGVFASPRYLAEHPAPRTVADLARHRCLGFVMPGSGRVLAWELAGADGAIVDATPPTTLRVAGDALGTIALAREGAGLVQTYDFAVAEALARGELVEVLAHARGAARTFSVVYPAGVVHTPATKALIATLVPRKR